MTKTNETNNLTATCCFTCIMSFVLVAAALLIYFFIPTDSKIVEVEPEHPVLYVDLSDETEEDLSVEFQDYFAEVKLSKGTDDGLTLYRQPLSRAAVEWFYYQITGNKSVTQAILSEADKNNIPLSLAFSLAHTESNYRVNATNKNKNNTIDRGLFQLNSNSFPALTEEDFFDPFVSSKYGMSHLRFCLNTAGNEVSALAMYNAGTNRVRSNSTPQTTLNYVGNIISYQKTLDQMFADQVTTYFDTPINKGVSVAYAGTQR